MSKVQTLLDKFVKEVKEEKKTRYSSPDFQELLFEIVTDKDFKAKKFVIKANEIIESEYSIREQMELVFDKLLKHAKLESPVERKALIDSFKLNKNDVMFMLGYVEEAMYSYIEAGKSMKLFKDKIKEVGLKKVVRTGKYAGQITIKRTFVDKEKKVAKKKSK